MLIHSEIISEWMSLRKHYIFLNLIWQRGCLILDFNTKCKFCISLTQVIKLHDLSE